MPTVQEHAAFFRSWPSRYEAWYVLIWSGLRVGSVYLTHGQEIGLFLDPKFQKKGLGAVALGMLKKLHPKPAYLANIAPGNEVSARFFERHGFRLIQRTYELEGV